MAVVSSPIAFRHFEASGVRHFGNSRVQLFLRRVRPALRREYDATPEIDKEEAKQSVRDRCPQAESRA
jgi:hypothetical protein